MPHLETPDELAEQVADWCGRWGIGTQDEPHTGDCKCRLCFVGMVERRIRESVENERVIRTGRKPATAPKG